MYCYKSKLTFPIYISDQKFENSIDFLLLTNQNILTDLCLTKQRIKIKKYFCKSCLQCFSSKNVLTEHKEDCLSINGAQSVKLEKGATEFKNYFKQIPVLFKIYADFECNLKSVESYKGFYSKKISRSRSL